jgi:hypothetical protein
MNSAFARQHRSGLLKAIEIVEPLVADRIILLQLLLLLKRLVFLGIRKVASLVPLLNCRILGRNQLRSANVAGMTRPVELSFLPVGIFRSSPSYNKRKDNRSVR